MQAARALAVIEGRDYVIPVDIKRLAPAVLRHRLALRPRAAAKGLTAKRLLEQLLETVPV
jgi:MoxR-like ATPase